MSASAVEQTETEVKVAETVSAKMRMPEDYNTKIIPLRRIAVDKFSAIMDSFPVGNDVDATVVAARATMRELHGLWYTEDSAWRSVRDRVHVGIIKDTKHHGNTSVSMGFAKKYFSGNPDATKVTFLNCGSGGIKYQHYCMENGIIYVAYELKPKDGASPNAIELCGFKPKKPIENNVNRNLLGNELFQFHLKMDEVFRHYPGLPSPAFSLRHGEVFAFITGSVRGFWEKQNAEIKDKMEAEMREYFSNMIFGTDHMEIKPFAQSYFISQEEEGQLEALGTSQMYKNLRVAGLIGENVGIIGVFGKGQGSAQKVFQSPDGKDNTNCNFPVGMSKPAELEKLPWSTIPAMKGVIGNITEWASQCKTPVIALKSGCVLWITSSEGAGVLELIQTPVTSSPDSSGIIARMDAFMKATAAFVEKIGEHVAAHTNSLTSISAPSHVTPHIEVVSIHDGRTPE